MASFRIYACSCFLPCASPVRLARLHPALFRLNSRKESLVVASRPWSSFFQTTFCTHLPGVKPAVRACGSEHENAAVAPEGTAAAAVVSVEAEGGEGGGDSKLVHVELQKEMAESYLSYAMSVLLGRALPDVRDGLKPVHRRILFAMHELGLASRKPFKKSARVVGEVLGKFHPHGDSAVYDALVRMAQDFSLRSPLIAGHGNFGSLDADPPAAMRYTECRLDPLAEEMLLADLGQDTVAFTPNFDGSQQEPSVFPARLPNILLNGASGIAVGMATNIPPHNLGEVVDALCALIHNSNATVQELMEFLPGPDFPTGGQILGTLGILAAYRTGRGKIIVRGTVKMEEATEKNQRSLIVITEIPFQTNKAALVKQMSDLVENKTLEGISDLLDESDRDGMRVVVEVKRGANAAVVLNNLYKHTKLQTSFNCNIIGIVDGKPELMGLKEILQSFLEFRCSVVIRRANYMLKQAEDRDHIIKGMLIGLEHLDLFVETTRNAENASIASELLQKKLNLTHVQADALLSMTVRRFTGLERKKLVEEHTHLESQINDLKALLASKTRILQLVEKEALALKRDFSTPRRTNLVQSDDGELSDIDIIANEDALVVISERGYIKRMKPLEFAAQRRGTWGKSSGKLKTNDTLSDSVFCRTHDYLLFFSEKGIVYSTRVFQIPELSRTATGTPLVQLIHIPPGERITSIKAVTDFPADQFLVMLTAFGYIKRTPLQLFSGIRVQGITAIQLGPGDELKLVKLAAAEDTIVIGSQHGNVIRVVCDETRFRALSRHARGVKSMRFKDGDKPAAMDIVQAGVLNNLREKGLEAPWLLFVTGRGYGKRVPLSAFPISRLGRVGVKGYNFIHKEDWLASIFLVGTNVADDGETTEEVILASNGGVMNRFKVRDVSTRKNRITSGIMLMRLEENDKVNSVSLVSSLNSDENSEVLDEQTLEVIKP